MSVIDVATKLRAVTPSDDTVLDCIGLYVGTAGDVAIMAREDTAAVTLADVPAGTLLPIACKKVMATNTHASADIVALY